MLTQNDVATEFIANGLGSGPVASRLLRSGMNVNVLKPWIGQDGRSYMAMMVGNELKAVPVANAPATLLKDEWEVWDDIVVRTAKPRMRAWGDLRQASSLIIPNGMGKTMIAYQVYGDITPATISMSPLRQSERDRPESDTRHLPLPIIHKDFFYDIREVEESRNGRIPLDTGTIELASRRVAEEAEKLTIGVASSYSYGGGTVYGYVNFPQRNAKAMTLPTAGGWTGETLIDELLDMIQMANDDGFYGPFRVYYSSGWNKYFGADFKAASDSTLGERVTRIPGIQSISALDYLTGHQMILVQMTPDVGRAVVGMDVQTVQWESEGGFQLNFKVLAILVPHLKYDPAGNSGIVHGVAA